MDEYCELDANGLEVWRGGVNTWECDEMGHLNVRFYVSRAMEGLVGVAAALGLPGAFRANAGATLMVKDHHIRFLREARPRATLHMVAGVLEMDEAEARVLQLLVHSGTGEIAASFQSLIAHATARDERPFAWSRDTRARAAPLMTTAPAQARPRSLNLDAATGEANLAKANALSLVPLSAGAFAAADCDVFGRVRTELFIGKISDGVPGLGAALRGDGGPRPSNVGGAVLEYRIAYQAWPRAGDRFEIRSGLSGVDARAQRMVHWVLDPESGRAWVTAEAVAIALDLDARKIIPLTESDQARLRQRITPGLSL